MVGLRSQSREDWTKQDIGYRIVHSVGITVGESFKLNHISFSMQYIIL